MLRLLHTADVHLGARYRDLGPVAVTQRERQMAAFRATVELALAERVDLFVVAGDLFDSNTQPARSVHAVAAELKRLADAGVRVVLLPGTHDVFDPSSIYRAYDLPALAGHAADDAVVLLTPERSSVHYPTLDLTVHGRCFATKRGPRSPLADFDARADGSGQWQVGVIHGSLRIPEKTEHDEVVFTTEEVAASGLDYLALGHWHSYSQGHAGATTYAYSGAPEPVALDQDRAGQVLLVTLDETNGTKAVTIEPRTVGRTRFLAIDVDAARVASQAALEEQLRNVADPDTVLDGRLTGIRPDALDLDLEELERALAPAFLRVRLRDRATPALPEGPLPPPDTIPGAFIRDLEARIEAATGAGRTDEADELRDALRLGRLLLAGHEVTL